MSLCWLSSHKKDHPLVEPKLTAQRFLLDLLLDAVDGNTCHINMVTFSCFTEHKRGDHIYRAHPDYPLKSLSVVHICQLCAYRMRNMTIRYRFDGVPDYFKYFFWTSHHQNSNARNCHEWYDIPPKVGIKILDMP
jgi:hypothetical protein